MSSPATSYPATFEVDESAPQGRLGVFFRIILTIPHMIVLGILTLVSEILTFLAWLAVLFAGRYPAGFANFNAGILCWQARLNGYSWLLTSQYPPFSLAEESEYAVRPTFDVALEGRSRLTVFFRPILAIPHLIVYSVFGLVGSIVLLIAWFAALFTGSVPQGMHTLLANVQRYNTRLSAYMWLLTDEYPPFSFS